MWFFTNPITVRLKPCENFPYKWYRICFRRRLATMTNYQSVCLVQLLVFAEEASNLGDPKSPFPTSTYLFIWEETTMAEESLFFGMSLGSRDSSSVSFLKGAGWTSPSFLFRGAEI